MSTPSESEVIVVGAGLAGNAAALSAAEAGASVLLLERGSSFGGSSLKAGGGFLFANTPVQAEHGMVDDPEQLRRDLLAASKMADPATVGVYVERQGETYDWLVKSGVEFRLLPTNVPGQISRIHDTMPGSAVNAIHERVLAHPNIAYLTSVTTRQLLRSADGVVDGIAVTIEGSDRDLQASRGVVLASGGFTQSPELLQIFAPLWVDAMKMGGGDNTGEGLRLAWALGARVADMGYIQASFGASIPNYPDLVNGAGDVPRLLYPNAQGAMIVNLDGRRFVNEDLSYKLISGICAQQPRGIAVQLFDQKVMDRSSALPGPWHFRGALDDGLLKQADTIGGLAAQLGIESSALTATVSSYNEAADGGHDAAFGRTIEDYGRSGGARIDQAPFYGFPCTSGLTTTYCGLGVDAELRVQDVFGRPIEGLYAAGEIVGGFHGASYVGGTALGKAAVFGRVAGLAAAARQ
jgi:fumarate reductase flavoprotein subunit